MLRMSTLSVQGLKAHLDKLGASSIEAILDNLHLPADFGRILSRPIDIYRVYLADILLTKLAVDCAPIVAYESFQSTNNLTNGDLVLPVPRLQLKKKPPVEQCVDLATHSPDNHPLVQKPRSDGIHLPVFFSKRSLLRLILPYVFDRQSSYGQDRDIGLIASATEPSCKKVIIEFSSPNIAKEFHAGHLRSTIIGAFISNLYEAMGWDVVRMNYLGDWGKQFGLLAVGWRRFGSEDKLAKEPLKHLLEVYARISALFKPEQDASRSAHKEGRDTAEIESQGLYAERNSFFRRMEDGDADAVALWRRFRDISIDRYVALYARLNISFDEYSGESQVQTESVDAVERVLKERGVYVEKDGSWLIDFEKYGFKGLGTAVVRGRTGTTTYLLRDVAAVLEREEKHAFDKMIYVVSSEQDLYFKRIFKTLELMGRSDLGKRLEHINFGKVEGMSSRLGNAKLLSDILDESGASMHEVMRRNAEKYAQVDDPDAVAETVGLTAVMVQDMSGKRINNYPFDMARMMSFEGDTGPYLQYCHARLSSILRKVGVTAADLKQYIMENPNALDIDADKEHCINLLRLIAQYPDVTAMAFRNHEPSTILTYLFRLTHQVSSCYDVIRVIGSEEGRDVTLSRAALYEGARQVLANGMRLLGLNPVDR
ncbi:unnamed protein product [Discula destructiva]